MKRFFKNYGYLLANLAVTALLAVIAQICTGDCKFVLAGSIVGSTIGTICEMEDTRKEEENE